MTGMVTILSSVPSKVIAEISGSRAHQLMLYSTDKLISMYLPVCKDLFDHWDAANAPLALIEAEMKSIQEMPKPRFFATSQSAFHKERFQQLANQREERIRERVVTEMILHAHLKQLKVLTSIADSVKQQWPETFSLIIEGPNVNTPEVKILNYRFELPFPHKIPSELSIKRHMDDMEVDSDKEFRIRALFDEVLTSITVERTT